MPVRGGFRQSVPGVVSAVAFLALYVFVFGTQIGSRWDADAKDRLAGLGSPTELDLFDNALDTLWVWVAAVVVAAVVHAVRGAVVPVLRVTVVLVLSNGAVLLLRRLLYEVDPLGGEEVRGSGVEAFPSAHTAVAISIAVAALMLAPVHLHRVVATLGGLAAAFIGLASIVEGGHYPSDAVGAFLAVFAVASFIGVAGANDDAPVSQEPWSRGDTATVVGVSLVAAAVVLVLGAATDLVGTEHTAGAAAAALLTALAVAVLLGVGLAVSVGCLPEAQPWRRNTRTSRARRRPEV